MIYTKIYNERVDDSVKEKLSSSSTSFTPALLQESGRKYLNPKCSTTTRGLCHGISRLLVRKSMGPDVHYISVNKRRGGGVVG